MFICKPELTVQINLLDRNHFEISRDLEMEIKSRYKYNSKTETKPIQGQLVQCLCGQSHAGNSAKVGRTNPKFLTRFFYFFSKMKIEEIRRNREIYFRSKHIEISRKHVK